MILGKAYLKKIKELSDPKVTEPTKLRYFVFFPKEMGIPCKLCLPLFFWVGKIKARGWMTRPSASTVASCPNKICFSPKEERLTGAYKLTTVWRYLIYSLEI